MSNSFPYICECGFNTMRTSRAIAHADKHLLDDMRHVSTRTLQNARDRAVYICPVGYASDTYIPYYTHDCAFYVTAQELRDIGNLVLCEFCETECVRLN